LQRVDATLPAAPYTVTITARAKKIVKTITIDFSIDLDVSKLVVSGTELMHLAPGYTPPVGARLAVPSDIVSIMPASFSSKQITYIDLKNVETIGDQAFAHSGLHGEIYLPDTITSVGINSFQECYGITGVRFPNNPNFTIIPISLFRGCGAITGDLNIPNSVTLIENDAFHDCSGLNGNLNIPNSVTSLGFGAFQNCSGFTEDLLLPDSIKTINDLTFSGCSNISSVTLPSLLESIGDSSFEACTNLSGNVEIPATCLSIDDNAFNGNLGINSLTIS
jgi:hypothetical protein